MNRIKRKATVGNNENNSNLVGRGGRAARGGASDAIAAARGGRGAARGGARGGNGSRGGANASKRPSERSTISDDDKPMKKIVVSSPSKLNIKIATGTNDETESENEND